MDGRRPDGSALCLRSAASECSQRRSSPTPRCEEAHVPLLQRLPDDDNHAAQERHAFRRRRKRFGDGNLGVFRGRPVAGPGIVLSPGNTRHTLKESRSAFDDCYAHALARCRGSGAGRVWKNYTKRPMALAVLGRLSCTHHLLAADSRHQAALAL
jgi:hypothetical protein